MSLYYFRVLLIIIVINFINTACSTSEFISESRIEGSGVLTEITGDVTVKSVTQNSVNDNASITLSEKAFFDYTYEERYKKIPLQYSTGLLIGSLVFLAILPFADSFESDDPNDGEAGSGVLAAFAIGGVAGWIASVAQGDLSRFETKRIQKKGEGELSIFGDIQIGGEKFSSSNGKVHFDLYHDLGILTAHSAYLNIPVTYKENTETVRVDIRQRNLTPSLARLAEYNDQIERFEDIRESWIARYVDREIDQLMTPRGEFETELDYLNRIEQIENRRDELTKQAEEAYAEQLRDFMKPVEREREHINRQFEKLFTASVENVNYSVDSELLEFRLRFTETSTPSFGIRTRLSRDKASTLVPHLRSAGGRAAEVEFILSDDDQLLIEKIMVRDRANNPIEITDIDYL